MPARTVLVVDDNASIRSAVCELFRKAGGDFEICGEAENGVDAINQATFLRPDLIIIDFSMPIMNGLQATQIIRKLMPTVPIILYSIHSDPFIVRLALAAGATAVVAKSDSAIQLVTTARELLLRSQENLPKTA